ncbi:MAG: NUDIX domain-containing protein [Salinivirgaceae bacterium]|nr:NUDIX domain-containing protein [Salinivirgaceae bacterium]
MAQKYKVFLFGNVIVFTNKADLHRKTDILYELTDSEDFKQFVFDYLAKRKGHHVRVVCTDVERGWADFCRWFEVRRAAGGLVVNADGDYLFIRRKGLWDIPKGHIEPGESSQDGGLREVEEECGISGMRIERLICTTWHTYWIESQPVLKSTDWYLMHYSGQLTLKPQTNEDITEAVWVKPENIDTLLENSFSSIPEVMKQLRDKKA